MYGCGTSQHVISCARVFACVHASGCGWGGVGGLRADGGGWDTTAFARPLALLGPLEHITISVITRGDLVGTFGDTMWTTRSGSFLTTCHRLLRPEIGSCCPGRGFVPPGRLVMGFKVPLAAGTAARGGGGSCKAGSASGWLGESGGSAAPAGPGDPGGLPRGRRALPSCCSSCLAEPGLVLLLAMRMPPAGAMASTTSSIASP